MKVWVTGAKGLVGGHVLQRVADCVGSGREVDIADEAQVRLFIEKNGPFTHIFNCAAFSAVDLAESCREKALRDNVQGPHVLGKVASEKGIKLLHLSTDYVFSGCGDRLLTEEDEPSPCNYYGWTKLEGEKCLQNIYPAACIIRTSWVFGQGGKNFAVKVLQWLQEKERLDIVFDQVSRYTYAPDLVLAMVQMADGAGVYHFANSGVSNKYEFTQIIQEEALQRGCSLRCRSIEPVKSSAFAAAAQRPAFSPLDTQKIQKVLGAAPRHWKDALIDYLDGYAS